MTTNRPDAVLIVGAGVLQVPAIREAMSLGLVPYCTDGNQHAPGRAVVGDPHFYPLDTTDSDEHRRLVAFLQQHVLLRGVMTCGADVAPTVAAAAEAAGTPGIPVAIAQTTANKIMVRHALESQGLKFAQPRWGTISLAPGHDWHAALLRLSLDCGDGVLVVKPPCQRASRGITIVREPAEIPHALAVVHPYLQKDQRVLVEQCLTGTEHSAEMIIGTDGRPIFFNVVDRMFRYDGGVAMEVGHVNPSRVDAATWQAMRVLVEQAAQALGVSWGPFKCDLMLTQDDPKILECTARLSGGFDCQETTPRATGRNPIRQVLQLACGLPVEYTPPQDVPDAPPTGRYAACCAAFPPPGRILALPRENVVRAMSGVWAVYVTARRGQVLEPYTHCAQRPGFVITVGRTYDNAWRRAEEAAQVLTDEFVVEKT